jgi:U2 small nuclear ribonucleoprotein A'
MANNRITRVDVDLADYLPNLHTMVLTNNHLAELGDLEAFTKMKYLEYLTLIDNPVTSKDHYRSYLIYKLPKLRVLDFQKITKAEREAAKKLFLSKDGLELENSLKTSQKTFEPGQMPIRDPLSQQTLSEEETARIRAAIAQATSLEEIHMLERRLKSGYVPEKSILKH